jgi:hypothetical protein
MFSGWKAATAVMQPERAPARMQKLRLARDRWRMVPSVVPRQVIALQGSWGETPSDRCLRGIQNIIPVGWT